MVWKEKLFDLLDRWKKEKMIEEERRVIKRERLRGREKENGYLGGGGYLWRKKEKEIQGGKEKKRLDRLYDLLLWGSCLCY